MPDKRENAAAAPEKATVHTDRGGKIENTTSNKFGDTSKSKVNISAGNIGGSAM